MLALVIAVTSSLRFGQSSRLRSAAVKYAQEGIELARQYRDSHAWSEFYAFADPGSTWCLAKDNVWVEDSGSGCTLIDNTFTRTVTFSWNDPLVQVSVDVTWQDGSRPGELSLETYLTQW
jgi:hypothetical protein